MNKATSYIDGSYVYGNNLIRALYLQADKSAKLATGDTWSKYPQKNKEGLPFVANPDPMEHKFHDQYDFWSNLIRYLYSLFYPIIYHDIIYLTSLNELPKIVYEHPIRMFYVVFYYENMLYPT